MRYIFLDIDGVLATDATYAAWRRTLPDPTDRNARPATRDAWIDLIDPSKMQMLNDFGHTIGASVVVSSAWKNLVDDIAGLLRDAGLTLPVVGVTPDHEIGHRGVEINKYIVDNALDLNDVVAFDDDAYANRTPHWSSVRHGARVIQTPGNTGLNAKLLARALRLFGM